jgi:hypothetical protein
MYHWYIRKPLYDQDHEELGKHFLAGYRREKDDEGDWYSQLDIEILMKMIDMPELLEVKVFHLPIFDRLMKLKMITDEGDLLHFQIWDQELQRTRVIDIAYGEGISVSIDLLKQTDFLLYLEGWTLGRKWVGR